MIYIVFGTYIVGECSKVNYLLTAPVLSLNLILQKIKSNGFSVSKLHLNERQENEI